jgi:hypothetical protein
MAELEKQAQFLTYLTINNSYGKPSQDLFKSSYLLGFHFLFIKSWLDSKTCESLRSRVLVLFKGNSLFGWF